MFCFIENNILFTVIFSYFIHHQSWYWSLQGLAYIISIFMKTHLNFYIDMTQDFKKKSWNDKRSNGLRSIDKKRLSKKFTPLCSGLLFTTKTILCGIWRSKNGLRMLSMAKRLGSMSLNSPIVSQKYQTNSPFRLDCIYVSQFYPRHTLCSILLFKFWCYKFSLDTHLFTVHVYFLKNKYLVSGRYFKKKNLWTFVGSEKKRV